MKRPRPLFELLDLKPLVRGARIRLGSDIRFSGVPAILIGVACIVAAAGAAGVLRVAIPLLPDTIREGRELLKTIRAGRRELNP
jgi:hypothetical protein